MRLEWRELDDVSREDLAHWRALGRSACAPNPYLMPEFLVPAARYLDPQAPPRLAMLWQGPRLVALGAFRRESRSVRFPFPSLIAFRSYHSFQSGVLLHEALRQEAALRLLESLLDSGCRRVHFAELRADTAAYRALASAARQLGLRWFGSKAYWRAGLDLTRPRDWESHVSKSRHKRMHASLRRLQRVGAVNFRVLTGDAVDRRAIDDFLRLEGAGWKAATSLQSRADSERFFRELCTAARGELVFCELLVDGTVIASTTNFVIGTHGFAFKTGHDPEFGRYSPGLLVEYETLRHLDAWPAGVTDIESGAQAGSFIDDFWPARVPIVTGALVSGRMACAFTAARHAHRRSRSGSPPQTMCEPVGPFDSPGAVAERDADSAEVPGIRHRPA